jgi:protein-tyrosine phosphatase
MSEAMNKKQNVLVFCRAGMSRSATITIYYLMKRYNISYFDGYRFLKSKRQQIEPNSGFIEQLLGEEENLLQSQLT